MGKFAGAKKPKLPPPPPPNRSPRMRGKNRFRDHKGRDIGLDARRLDDIRRRKGEIYEILRGDWLFRDAFEKTRGEGVDPDEAIAKFKEGCDGRIRYYSEAMISYFRTFLCKVLKGA